MLQRTLGFLISFVGFVIFMIGPIFSQGLLVDHTSVQDFDHIPEVWLQAAKQLTLHYAHASHGMEVVSGLKYLRDEIDADKYAVSYIVYYAERPDPSTALPEEESPPKLRIADTGRTPDGYWSSADGLAETRNFAATGLYDFSMFGWCGELSGSLDLREYINSYLTTLDNLEKDFPNMRFIYQTGHSDGYPAYSKLRQNNNQIRDYCKANNKILYDFADIESWDPDGNFYPENYNCSWCAAWCEAHPEECVNLPPESDAGIPTCCPHTHGYNCYIKGKAFWYMMARLAGWDGDISVPVDLFTFDGFVIGNDVKLVWKTVSEKNNYGFEIQRRSQESESFKKIGFIFGNDTTVEANEYSFVDQNLKQDIYYYRLKQMDKDGSFKYLGQIRIAVNLSHEFLLMQNYPNPFNASTSISYMLPENNDTELFIYDLNGAQVFKLVSEFQQAGSYHVTWNATNISSGLYYCRLVSGAFEMTKKMLIIR